MVYTLIGFRQVYLDKQYYYLIACFAFMQNHLKKNKKKTTTQYYKIKLKKINFRITLY